MHQFLEAKHGLEIEEESLTLASLCHPVYFNRYQSKYGLTGTFGENVERSEVERTYNVTSFDVPPHRKNLRNELPPLLCADEEEHHACIFKEVQKIAQEQRPVLILCETIQASLDLSKFFQKEALSFQLLNELQAESETFVISRAGNAGVVTIATNTAGRGTDIILSPTSRQNGGLHVILTFFPENDRVENQAFGRCARQGQLGSCRFIIQTKDSFSLLSSKRAKKVKQASLERLQRIQIEKKHAHFLFLFLQQLQQFYDVPLEKFSKKDASFWLEKAKRDNRIDSTHLIPFETFLQTAEEEKMFQKKIQSDLGHLAQQYWSYFFYDSLSDLDPEINTAALYRSLSPVWETIFEIVK